MGNLNPYYNESFVFIVEQEQLRVCTYNSFYVPGGVSYALYISLLISKLFCTNTLRTAEKRGGGGSLTKAFGRGGPWKSRLCCALKLQLTHKIRAWTSTCPLLLLWFHSQKSIEFQEFQGPPLSMAHVMDLPTSKSLGPICHIKGTQAWNIFFWLFCRNRILMVPRACNTRFLKIVFDSAEIFDF